MKLRKIGKRTLIKLIGSLPSDLRGQFEIELSEQGIDPEKKEHYKDAVKQPIIRRLYLKYDEAHKEQAAQNDADLQQDYAFGPGPSLGLA